MTDEYIAALDYLLARAPGWSRAQIVADGTSAGWHVASQANTPEEAERAQRAGVIVDKGKPQWLKTC